MKSFTCLNFNRNIFRLCTFFLLYAFTFSTGPPFVSSIELDSDFVFDNSEDYINRNNNQTIDKRNAESLTDEEGWLPRFYQRAKRDLLDWLYPITVANTEVIVESFDHKLINGTKNDNETTDSEPLGEFAHTVMKRDSIIGDDEDLNAISGEGSAEIPNFYPETTNASDSTVYYRVTFTAIVTFEESWRDHRNTKYVSLSTSIIQAIDDLYRDFPGEQKTQGVVLVEPRPSDVFSSKLTVDFQSVGYNNEENIKNHLYNYIKSYQKLGNHPVSVDDFSLRQFKAVLPAPSIFCLSNELSCRDGMQCVPSSSRCNGRRDCPDGSDEEGCHSNSTTADSTCDDASNFRCNDGECIPLVNRCDTIADCDDRSDEINCYGREPPIISIAPSKSQTVVIGGSAIIQCKVEAGIPTPTIVWTRSTGLPLGSHLEHFSNGILRINNVTKADIGEYLCTAENFAGKVTATTIILVETVPTITLNPSGIYRVEEFKPLKLECHAEGFPLPTVKWFKRLISPLAFSSLGAEEISIQTLTFELPSTVVYEIRNVSADDQGSYSCQAKNSAGVFENRVYIIVDTFSHIKMKIPQLNFKEIPEPPPTRNAPEGSTVELVSESKSATSYTEIRSDSFPFQRNSELIRKEEVSKIIKFTDEEAGDDCCDGIENSRPPFSLVHRLMATHPPRITLRPPKQIVRPGDNAYVQCIVTGTEPISISWSGKDRILPTSANVRDGILQFESIQISDAGIYVCDARNVDGEISADAEFIIEEVVEGPVIIAENRQQTGYVGSAIILHCRVRGVDRSAVQWSREKSHLPDSSQINGEYLIIKNLKIYDSGRYICEVLGSGGSSSDFIDLQVIDNVIFH